MQTDIHPKRKLLLVASILSLLAQFFISDAQAINEISWQQIETRYTIVRYQRPEDLEKFNRQLNYFPGASGLKWLLSDSGTQGLEERVKKKVDSIYARVQEILDMRKSVEKVNINIYHDTEELHEAFYSTYKKKCRLRAWYIYELKTIYVNVNDLHEGMLAHEMAHHLIDHYLAVRPPSATAEILARYVDAHLSP